VFVQPVAVMVSTTVYVVVNVGLTVGLDATEVNPAGTEVQLKVLPETGGPPIEAEAPEQIAASAPATAAGIGKMVM